MASFSGVGGQFLRGANSEGLLSPRSTRPLPFPPFRVSSPRLPFLPLPSSSLPSIPLDVGPPKGAGARRRAGYGAQLQLKSDLVHYSLKI